MTKEELYSLPEGTLVYVIDRASTCGVEEYKIGGSYDNMSSDPKVSMNFGSRSCGNLWISGRNVARTPGNEPYVSREHPNSTRFVEPQDIFLNSYEAAQKALEIFMPFFEQAQYSFEELNAVLQDNLQAYLSHQQGKDFSLERNYYLHICGVEDCFHGEFGHTLPNKKCRFCTTCSGYIPYVHVYPEHYVPGPREVKRRLYGSGVILLNENTDIIKEVVI